MRTTSQVAIGLAAASGGGTALAQIDFTLTTAGTTTFFSETESSYAGAVTAHSPNFGFLTMSSSSVFDPASRTAEGPGQWTGALGIGVVILKDAALAAQQPGFFEGTGTWQLTSGTGIWDGYTGEGTYHSFVDFSTGATQMEFVGTIVPSPGAAPLLGAGGLLLGRRRRPSDGRASARRVEPRRHRLATASPVCRS